MNIRKGFNRLGIVGALVGAVYAYAYLRPLAPNDVQFGVVLVVIVLLPLIGFNLIGWVLDGFFGKK